jgi:hypothetical protein
MCNAVGFVAGCRGEAFLREPGASIAITVEALTILRKLFASDLTTEGYLKDGPIAVARFELEEGEEPLGIAKPRLYGNGRRALSWSSCWPHRHWDVKAARGLKQSDGQEQPHTPEVRSFAAMARGFKSLPGQPRETGMIEALNFENAYRHGDALPVLLRMRYGEFVERLKYEVPNYNGMEYDQYV